MNVNCNISLTWMIVVEVPRLNVVLGQLGVGQQLHGGGHQLHVVLIKLLQLQVHSANLGRASLQYFHWDQFSKFSLVYNIHNPQYPQSKYPAFREVHSHLCIKRIMVKEVGAVECFTMCLVEGNYVLHSFEYFNL